MRPMILALVAAAMLFATASAVRAAPTCQDENGQTVRCGTSGAMPVGWTLPLDQRASKGSPPPPPMAEIIALICLVGGFLGLIALMPDFDGRGGGGWDQQEDDEEQD